MIHFRVSAATEIIEHAQDAASHGEAVRLYAQAALLADRMEDVKTAYAARVGLIEAAMYADLDVDLILAFTYCLNAADQHPDLFDASELMWEYKWVIEGGIGVIAIPVNLLERLIDDLERRYAECGLGSAPAAQLRLELLMRTNQVDRLDEAFNAWRENSDTRGADCRACQQHLVVYHHLACRRYEQAWEEAEPLVKDRMSCADVPHRTFGGLLRPLVTIGRESDAIDLHVRGLDLIRSGEGFTAEFGEHMEFLAIAGETDRALGILQSRLRDALRSNDHITSLSFHRGAWAACERAVLDGRSTASLSLTPRFELYESDGIYDLAVLRDHFRSLAASLAADLDARNHNEIENATLESVAELVGERRSIPIPD